MTMQNSGRFNAGRLRGLAYIEPPLAFGCARATVGPAFSHERDSDLQQRRFAGSHIACVHQCRYGAHAIPRNYGREVHVRRLALRYGAHSRYERETD